MLCLNRMMAGSVLRVLLVPFHSIILTMILISSLHCLVSILKVTLILIYLNRLKNFNPFFDDPETSHLLLNSNLDPDTNFFSANSELLSNCLYLTSTEFNKMPSLPPDTFSSLHINIRSLPKHFDDLSEFLLTLNRSFSVIAVSETWLHRSNSDLFHLPGYHFISSHREHKAGGGVGLYIQSHLEFKLRTDLQSPNNALYESIPVEIIQPRGKNIDDCWLFLPTP